MLTPEQLETFHRDGIIALPGWFSPDDVAAIDERLQELLLNDARRTFARRGATSCGRRWVCTCATTSSCAWSTILGSWSRRTKSL
jgi:hypothetical protein